MTIISYFHKDEISPLRYTSVVRSESDGIASKQMRLVRASMTITSYIHKDEISPFHSVTVEMTVFRFTISNISHLD